jgi:hypothetical protein
MSGQGGRKTSNERTCRRFVSERHLHKEHGDAIPARRSRSTSGRPPESPTLSSCSIEKWFASRLLDEVDVRRDPVEQAEELRARVPQLRGEFAHAQQWVADALKPLPPNHPADDTWDDQIWFQRAMGESRYAVKQSAVEAAEAELDELANSDDPAEHVASLVLTQVHARIKALGLGTAPARKDSKPASIGALPLAEIVWQARNQAHHHNDARDLDPPVLAVFRVLVADDPGLFGLSGPPADNVAVQRLLKKRSWAPHVLQLLGWNSATALARDVRLIAP